MNGLYQIGASLYRGVVITHWAFRRNRGFIVRVGILIMQVIGIVGIVALLLGACSARNAKSSGVDRFEMLWRACSPVYTGGGVWQCANPTRNETGHIFHGPYSRYLNSCERHGVLDSCIVSMLQGTLNEDDLARIARAVHVLNHQVFELKVWGRHVYCHTRIPVGAFNVHTWQMERNVNAVHSCYRHDVPPVMPALRVTR